MLAASVVLRQIPRTGQLERQRQRGEASGRLGRRSTHGWRRVGRKRGRRGRPGALAQLQRHGCERGAGCRGRRCVRGCPHRGGAVRARLGPQSMPCKQVPYVPLSQQQCAFTAVLSMPYEPLEVTQGREDTKT